MTSIPYWLRPAYRTLRHPPEDSLAYQLAYILLAVGASTSFRVHDGDHLDTLLAAFASAFAVSGSLVGWVSQFKGFWNFERGAIWAIWGGLVIRSFVVISISDASVSEIFARVGALLAVCVLLIPRYRSIQGADLDPRK